MGAAAYHQRSEHEHEYAAVRWHSNTQTVLGKAKEAWHALTPEQRAVYGIVGLNVGVFGLWRIPALQVRLTLSFLPAMPQQMYQELSCYCDLVLPPHGVAQHGSC